MFTLPKGSRFAVVIMSIGIITGTSQLAAAKTWYQAHPRRDEVNARLNRRIFGSIRSSSTAGSALPAPMPCTIKTSSSARKNASTPARTAATSRAAS
jgi:hypothetical protein